MPRFYHIDLAQHVVGTDARWIDNLISRFVLPGIEGSGRGASRRLTEIGIQHIALIWSLTRDLGLPISAAVAAAQSLLSAGADAGLRAGPWLRVTFNRDEFVRHVDALIADGVESITPTRRGRPPILARSSGR